MRDLLTMTGRQAPVGLVHDEQARRQQAGHGRSPASVLAARELGAAVALAIGQAREHRVDAVRSRVATRRHQPERLLDAERRPDAAPLRHVGDAAARDAVRRQAEDLGRRRGETLAARRHQAADRVHSVVLPIAVAADDAEDAARPGESRRLQRVGAAV